MPRASLVHRLALLLVLALAACATAPTPPASDAPPEPNRFTQEVLAEGMDQPMALEFDARGRVYWIERTGGVQRLDEATGTVTRLGEVPVGVVGEAGLAGFLLDPRFEETGHVFVYYSAPGDVREMRLARFTVRDDRLDPASEVVLLRWPYDLGSHMGGGMAWDADGNLLLSTGDNSDATQYTPIHWTHEGGAGQDAQRTAANTNDLRGKILRIRPEPDGTYTIPSGNLFAPGTPRTRPEIYVMGNRNPWRLSVDAATGYLYWGEVGPDAGADSAGVGPRGYDEFNVARAAGNFGWPFFIGANRAYHSYDYATHTHGPPFDPAAPVNPSPNNTGLDTLPPAQPALLAYPYGVSEAFPVLASGGRNAVGGPILRRGAFAGDAPRAFPAYYEGAWFVADFVRNWIMTVRTDAEARTITSLERFLPEITYHSIIDLDFGPSGDLYVLEYGTQWFQQNDDARLSKLVYNAGNRAPAAVAAADRTAGAVPLRVALSAEETMDHDGDVLTYAWRVDGPGGMQRLDGPRPTLALDAPGRYAVTLTATDPDGATGIDTLTIVAGNEPPALELAVTGGNRSFYVPGRPVAYEVTLADREDGALGAGIAPERVAVTAEYVASGLTAEETERAAALAPSASLRHLRAYGIIAGSDCRTCHTVDEPSAGPALRDVAARYAGDPGAAAYLARKIIEGGSGVWGEAPMPAHPALTPAEAATLAAYVLSLRDDAGAGPQPLPPAGRFTPSVPDDDAAPGPYVLRAAYTDAGAPGAAPITARDAVVLRPTRLAPEAADVVSDGVTYTPSRDPGFIVAGDGAYLGFRDVDLTGVTHVDVEALTRFYTWSHFVGARVEVRLDSPTGPRLGEPAERTPVRAPERAPAAQAAGGDNAPGGPVFFAPEPPATVALGDGHGVRDVYVVFSNPDAGPGDALLLLKSITFRLTP